MADTALKMYVIYDRPDDFPKEVVCRILEVSAGHVQPTDKLFARGDTIEEVRLQIPPGLTRILRSANDQPQIVETWL